MEVASIYIHFTGKFINELNSPNRKKTNNISEIKMGEEVITSPIEIAEAFIYKC